MTEKNLFDETGDEFLSQSIRAAFEPIAPDEAAKSRMLQGILAAASEEQAAAEPVEAAEPVQPIEFPSPAKTTTADAASASAKRKKRSSIGAGRRYSTIGIAACLVLIVGVGILVPNAMKGASSADFADKEAVSGIDATEDEPIAMDGSAKEAMSAESAADAGAEGKTSSVSSQNALPEQSGKDKTADANPAAKSADAGLADLMANRKYGVDAIQDGDPQVSSVGGTPQGADVQDYGWDDWIWFGQTEFRTGSDLTGAWRCVAVTTDSQTGETLYELGFTLSDGTDPGWKAIVSADAGYLWADFRYRST